MFDKFKRSSAAARLLEEALYEQVVNELSQSKKRNGLWAKALADSGGSEDKAKSLYIRYRVQSLKDESEMAEAIAEQEEHQRRQEEWQRKNAPIIERKKRVDAAEAILRSKGYKLVSKGTFWVIKEPAGGRQRIGSLAELEEYAISRKR
ncbi:hypothetical protein R0135_00620 [Congregibacter variabilis]|uniref:Uncharacterized protein n=1 Tax=Congregibacter variabilis TaxID=3081200 RepID=A0ABZ0I3C2_9GAMM|nr:hypothetical protein R0135_00620 [Congregibacter sp. IMCC43200]